MKRHLLLSSLLALAPVASGCGGDAAAGFLLPAGSVAGQPCGGDCAAAGFELSPPGRFAEVEIDHERRPAVLTGSDGWTWTGRVPAGAWLRLGVQAAGSEPAAGAAATRIEIEARRRGRREILEVASLGAEEQPGWVDLAVDLSRYAGDSVTLSAAAVSPPSAGELAWAPLGLVAAPRERGTVRVPRPNVLFVVIDTLRADHTSPYGYARDTSPAIQRLLAERGAVVETAYAQAPWTLPSAVSYMTGRYPGELLAGGMASFGIPESVAALPERMQALGYRTAGFFANPTLHAGNGFARGFDTFYTPPPVNESMLRHADDLSSRAIPWLAAHQHEPFFLYVHYLDPHDPYDNPDVESGVSPFYPDYRGTISGKWVHGVYTGGIPLENPDEDVAHLTALYDSEIRYVDRHVERLIETLDPEVLADTLVILTSDHGEELYDHGGWKHGQTLYQEQIHVPLLMRWDGRIAAASRLAGTVRLVDLVPTVLAAVARERPPEDFDGIDLLPALTGEAPLPRRPAFAQHLASGPLRAAAILDGWKLILFNRSEPFVPEDPLQDHLFRLDLARLERAELYDLATDPGERDDRLESAAADRLAALDAVIDRHLAGALGELTVVTGEGAGEGRLAGTLRLAGPVTGWMPYFLAPDDRVELDGDRVSFDLAGEPLGKGFTLLGIAGAAGARVEALELTLDGEPVRANRVVVGPGRAWTGEPVGAAALTLGASSAGAASASSSGPVPGRAAAGGEPPLLHLFRRAGARTHVAENPETRRRLLALGYLQ